MNFIRNLVFLAILILNSNLSFAGPFAGSTTTLMPPACPYTVIVIENNDFVHKTVKCNQLGQSIMANDFFSFKEYLNSKKFTKELSEGHYKDLIRALVLKKRTEMLKLALENKAIPISEDDKDSGYTPLFQAWYDGYTEGYDLLHKKGACHGSIVIATVVTLKAGKNMLVAKIGARNIQVGGTLIASICFLYAGYRFGYRAGLQAAGIANADALRQARVQGMNIGVQGLVALADMVEQNQDVQNQAQDH